MLPGSVVTVTGTVTNGAELGWQRYLQDTTAGIASYGDVLAGLSLGDSIRLRGVVSSYRGELQLSPVLSVELVASARSVAPWISSDVREWLEAGRQATRVRLTCAGVTSCYNEFREGPMRFFDASGTYWRLSVPAASPLIGQPIGTDMFLEGILGMLEDQPVLKLQDAGFNESGECLLVGQGAGSIDGNTLTATWLRPPGEPLFVEWTRQGATDTLVPFQGDEIAGVSVDVGMPGALHSFRLVCWLPSGDTIRSPWLLVADSDPAGPQPEFFFNRSLAISFSDGSQPDGVGSSVIESDIIRRIDEATATLDVAMYNTGRDPLVQALNRAVSRGVRVRYIADSGTSNGALDGPLSFQVLYREGDGIMHHKFVVGDAGLTGQAWVWAGSTNFSQNQLTQDPNNAFVVRDQALAALYTHEFEEMWGGLPGHADSRTGDLKTDDTAHDFLAGGAPAEVYFSPSDETGCHIARVIASADQQVLVALLLLTRDELTDALIERYQAGVDVRVIVDDEESSAAALARLRSAGVPVRVHRFSPIFHHKYAVVDEGTTSDPVVLTGSHNWTFSADRINDENVVIFHQQRVANLYRQEFEARWGELGTTATTDPGVGRGHRVYPNPASDWVAFRNLSNADAEVRLYTPLGIGIGRWTVAAGETKSVKMPEGPDGWLLAEWIFPSARTAEVLRIVR